jgi:hypothetical protein
MSGFLKYLFLQFRENDLEEGYHRGFVVVHVGKAILILVLTFLAGLTFAAQFLI